MSTVWSCPARTTPDPVAESFYPPRLTHSLWVAETAAWMKCAVFGAGVHRRLLRNGRWMTAST